MEIGHLKQPLYPRAVAPSVEGTWQQENPRSGLSQEPPGVRHKQAAQATAQRGATAADSLPQQRQQQLVAQYQGIEPEANNAQVMLAASLGEKLVQSRQVRLPATKRGYVPAAMVSATGKRAHADYLQVTRDMPVRTLVDETV